MNQSINIRQIALIAALAVFSLLTGPVMAAESGSQRYIVILKSRSGPVPDLAHLGGAVTFRQDDEVIVTLPPSALPSLRADPLVRYVQSVAGSDPGTAPLAGEPDEPTAGAPRRLVPHATAGPLSWSKQYTYDDAGNIINVGTQQFVYDALGRLNEMATAGSTTESYVYDRYGNQTSRTTSAGLQAMNTEPTTNRLSSGYGYDVAGNVTSGEGYVLAYDPLGQTATKTYTGTTTTFNETYIYTASDERIGVQTSKSSETSSWWYWSVRDESGKVLRQYRSSANDPTQAALWIEDYVYRDGQLVGAERPPTLGGRRHFHLDHLGSPRLITTDTGLIVSTHDYLPFGGESNVFQETGAGFDREDPMKFTGHERDYAGSFGSEDGHAIDYMHARYYSPTVGRFFSIDPTLAVREAQEAPQLWNRYAYVRDNPLNLTDPDGRLAIPWHWVITLIAARSSGKSLGDSIKLATATALVDTRKGSQGTKAKYTNVHAMRGKKDDGNYQTVQEGRDGTAASIRNSIKSNDLPAAVHTVEDLPVPAHSDQKWVGFGWNMTTLQHLSGDIAPSPMTIIYAFIGAKAAIKADDLEHSSFGGSPP